VIVGVLFLHFSRLHNQNLNTSVGYFPNIPEGQYLVITYSESPISET
jgi:hypothetical protein